MRCDGLIAPIRRGLVSTVKESVRNPLLDAVESSGLEVDWRGIYG